MPKCTSKQSFEALINTWAQIMTSNFQQEHRHGVTLMTYFSKIIHLTHSFRRYKYKDFSKKRYTIVLLLRNKAFINTEAEIITPKRYSHSLLVYMWCSTSKSILAGSNWFCLWCNHKTHCEVSGLFYYLKDHRTFSLWIMKLFACQLTSLELILCLYFVYGGLK